MLTRIITGIILIIIASFWMFSNDWQVFEYGTLLIMFVGSWEFARFFMPKSTDGKRKFNPFVQTLFAIILTLSFYFIIHFIPSEDSSLVRLLQNFISSNPSVPFDIFSLNPILLGFLFAGFAWWIVATICILKYDFGQILIKNLLVRFIASFLTLIPFGISLLIIRMQGSVDNGLIGSVCLLAVMILVWATDSGAYFSGKALGKNKLCPKISPNKTIEGLIGGLVLAFVVFLGMYLANCYGLYNNFVALSIAAILTIVISVFGDLVESLFKREAGIKDSGIIFPGHGGMLDRIDSLSASIPVFVVSYSLCSLFL